VVEALNRALNHRQMEPCYLHIHRDKGGRYQPTDLTDILLRRHISNTDVRQGLAVEQSRGEEFSFNASKLRLGSSNDEQQRFWSTPSICSADLASRSRCYYNRKRRAIQTIDNLRPNRLRAKSF